MPAAAGGPVCGFVSYGEYTCVCGCDSTTNDDANASNSAKDLQSTCDKPWSMSTPGGGGSASGAVSTETGLELELNAVFAWGGELEVLGLWD